MAMEKGWMQANCEFPVTASLTNEPNKQQTWWQTRQQKLQSGNIFCSTCQFIGVDAEDHAKSFMPWWHLFRLYFPSRRPMTKLLIQPKPNELCRSILQLNLFYVTRLVYVSHRSSSSGSFLLKHSDETFTATPADAYLPPCHIHIIETYEIEERDLVHFLAMRVGQRQDDEHDWFWILGRCR